MMFEEPTSKKANELLVEARKKNLSRYKATLYIIERLADKNSRVHMGYMDLVGLVLNLARFFKD